MSASALNARITAIGSYVPKQVLSNSDLEAMVETTDEWIVQRTGMRERRIAAADEYTSHLCIRAVENMVARYSTSLGDVELIIVATQSPDLGFPSIACLVQAHFGIPATGAYDLNAVCAGFTYAVHTASAMIAAGVHRKVLVIGADTMSKVMDYTDRTTCILFGDGAGAVMVERDDVRPSFLAHHQGTDGTGGKHLYRTGLAASIGDVALSGNGKLVQNGREVYKFSVTTVPQGMEQLMAKSGMRLSDIDWFIPHSANLRIIESICEKSGIPFEKSLYSLVYYGNTSAASIPLALDLGIQDGKVHDGDTLLLYGFGGGLTHAGLIVRWDLRQRL